MEPKLTDGIRLAGVHLLMAILLLLMLELAIEVCIRHARLGSEGYHSLYNWFVMSQKDMLCPDSLAALQRYSLGFYPKLVQWSMAVFDLPEAIAVTRNTLCTDGAASVSRFQMVCLAPVILFQPIHRLRRTEKFSFALSKQIFSGSKCPKNILSDFENRSTDVQRQ